MKCDIGTGITSCIVQHRMYKKGFVISYASYDKAIFIKPKKMLKSDEVMSMAVDWLMMHHSAGCLEVMSELEPDLYKQYKEEWCKQ